MEKHYIRSGYLKAKFGDSIDYGFTTIPNLLVDHAAGVELEDIDCWFIVQILRAHDRKKQFITDDDITMLSSASTIKRIRRRLKSIQDRDGNNLIEIKSFYVKSDESGHVEGVGTSYNFEKLFLYFAQEQKHIDRLVEVMLSFEKELRQVNLTPRHRQVKLTKQGQFDLARTNLTQDPPEITKNEARQVNLTHIYKELKNKELLKNVAKIFSLKGGISPKMDIVIRSMGDDEQSSIRIDDNVIIVKFRWNDTFFKQTLNAVLVEEGLYERSKIVYT